MLLLTYSWSVSTGKEPNPFYGYLWQSTLNWSPVCLLNTTLILICSEAVDDIYDFFLLSLSACFFGSQLFGVHCQVNGQTFPFGSSVSLPFFFFFVWCNFPSILNIGDRSIKRNPREYANRVLPALPVLQQLRFFLFIVTITPVSRVTSTLFQGPQVLVDDLKFQFCRTRVLSLGGSMPPSGIRILNE